MQRVPKECQYEEFIWGHGLALYNGQRAELQGLFTNQQLSDGQDGVIMVAGSTASGKSKARLFQKYVAASICETFGLSEYDAISRPMGSPGTDIIMSERARQVFPFSVECKRQEKLSIGKWMDQTCANAAKDQLAPLLVIRQNRDAAIAVLLTRHYMKVVEKVGYPDDVKMSMAISSKAPRYKNAIEKAAAISDKWIVKAVSPQISYTILPYMLLIISIKKYATNDDNDRSDLFAQFTSYTGERK